MFEKIESPRPSLQTQLANSTPPNLATAPISSLSVLSEFYDLALPAASTDGVGLVHENPAMHRIMPIVSIPFRFSSAGQQTSLGLVVAPDQIPNQTATVAPALAIRHGVRH